MKDRVSRMLWKVRSTSFVCNLYVGWRGDIHQLVEVLTVSLRLDVQWGARLPHRPLSSVFGVIKDSKKLIFCEPDKEVPKPFTPRPVPKNSRLYSWENLWKCHQEYTHTGNDLLIKIDTFLLSLGANYRYTSVKKNKVFLIVSDLLFPTKRTFLGFVCGTGYFYLVLFVCLVVFWVTQRDTCRPFLYERKIKLPNYAKTTILSVIHKTRRWNKP